MQPPRVRSCARLHKPAELFNRRAILIMDAFKWDNS